MISKDTILPDSVAIFPHLQAFDLAAKEYLDQMQLEVLLVYFIDQVDSRALPILAQQFDVLGHKGWNLASTEQQKRDLLKRAIEFHRFKGTLWAVRESLKSIGFTDVIITEHVNGHWARFALMIENENVVLTASGFANIIAMVNEYKNTRSHLDAVIMKLTTNDEILFDEDEAFVNEQILVEDTVYLSGGLFYDGTGEYDGQFDHSGDADTVTIEEI